MRPDPAGAAPEEAFADALDAMVDPGAPRPATRDALGRFAAQLQAHAAIGVPETERSAIRERLLASRPPVAESPSPPVPGGGATPALPASTLRPAARRFVRPDRRALRFVPEHGGVTPLTLFLAVILLAGAMFVTLRPDDQRGFFPAASATEYAPATPQATAFASPAADCTTLVAPATHSPAGSPRTGPNDSCDAIAATGTASATPT